MAQDKNPASEPLQKSAQAANAIRGAVKTGKAIAGAAKGAAVGGPYGAAAGVLWGSRKTIGKIVIAIVAIMMIPILLLCMLPSIIFGGLKDAFSPVDSSEPILNSSTAVTENITDISVTLSSVLSDALVLTLDEIEWDFSSSGADNKEIINPYENNPNYNANQFIGQYCASKNQDFESVSLPDMEKILRSNKDKLYSYTRRLEDREIITTTITVNTATGEERETSTVTIEQFAVYTISYNGEACLADEVFHLSDEQKTLANDYAYNLSLFLGDSMFQGLPDGYNTIVPLGDIRFADGQTPVVYFNQTDERYAGQSYGTDNIGGYGCGPTSMAIVVSSLTDKTVDPTEMAKWAYEHGYWCAGNGSYHSLIPGAAEAWGLSVEGCCKDDGQKIVDALSNGKLVVAIMTKGHFTNSGHFIVLRGIKDGKILVADPFSYDRSQMTWDLSIILNEASTYAAAGGPFWIIG